MVDKNSNMKMASPSGAASGSLAMPSTGDYVDMHELAKGWKAAIARAKDPATRYVSSFSEKRIEKQHEIIDEFESIQLYDSGITMPLFI